MCVDDVIVPFRAYRIGQCRDVTVLRLISLGTVEEIIYLRQVYKQVRAPILSKQWLFTFQDFFIIICHSKQVAFTESLTLHYILFQQLQCTVVGKESARRYFEAVQGHGDHKGELFGVKNLFRMQVNGTCLTRKILEVRLPVRLSLTMLSNPAQFFISHQYQSHGSNNKAYTVLSINMSYRFTDA